LVADAGARDVAWRAIDVADKGAESALRELAAAVAPLALAVHAAGAAPHRPLRRLTDDDWRRAFDIKVIGALRIARVLHEHRDSQGASLALIAGEAAHHPDAEAPFGALNLALEHLSKSMALDMAADRIRVNVVHPGPTYTPRLERRAQEAGVDGATFAQAMEELIPLRRLVEPDEIADAVEYLHRAASVTGAALSVSAGRSATAL
jgi:NAD(P)-dependent dehydrogenase (short-subunit alcohol dehydrogenase family)